jgi:hypothetical protein
MARDMIHDYVLNYHINLLSHIPEDIIIPISNFLITLLRLW